MNKNNTGEIEDKEFIEKLKERIQTVSTKALKLFVRVVKLAIPTIEAEIDRRSEGGKADDE